MGADRHTCVTLTLQSLDTCLARLSAQIFGCWLAAEDRVAAQACVIGQTLRGDLHHRPGGEGAVGAIRAVRGPRSRPLPARVWRADPSLEPRGLPACLSPHARTLRRIRQRRRRLPRSLARLRRHGHGGNVGLRIRQPSDYVISVLEVAGSSATTEEILALEVNWKVKLQSRDIGLNHN